MEDPRPPDVAPMDPDAEIGDPLHLPSPREAVDVLAELVERRDWAKLARYYDLSEVGIEAWYVLGGYWFTTEPAPHVAIQWDGTVRFQRPFPPGFTYVSHKIDGDVATVVVDGSFDPGDGRLQEGPWTFEMRRDEEGWRLLPKTPVREAE